MLDLNTSNEHILHCLKIVQLLDIEKNCANTFIFLYQTIEIFNLLNTAEPKPDSKSHHLHVGQRCPECKRLKMKK